MHAPRSLKKKKKMAKSNNVNDCSENVILTVEDMRATSLSIYAFSMVRKFLFRLIFLLYKNIIYNLNRAEFTMP